VKPAAAFGFERKIAQTNPMPRRGLWLQREIRANKPKFGLTPVAGNGAGNGRFAATPLPAPGRRKKPFRAVTILLPFAPGAGYHKIGADHKMR